MPVLVLWGDSDTALGTNLLRGIEKVVAQPEVHVLQNCSHWVQQDKCAYILAQLGNLSSQITLPGFSFRSTRDLSC